MTDHTTSTDDSGGEPFEVFVSDGLDAWLEANDTSIAFALPPHKLVLVGRDEDGAVALFERTFDKTMGMAQLDSRQLFLGTKYQLWRFDDMDVPEEHLDDGFDRCFVPREMWTTGNINIHDVAVARGPAGPDDCDITFVATRFSCLGKPSEHTSFDPVWTPPFSPQFAPGDRCHLNGLTLDESGPAYVSAVGATNDLERWRFERNGGGLVMHVPTNEVVATGFSMPHSPRLWKGQLYLAHSGAGELVHIDPQSGAVEPVGFAPGFLRGLGFVNDYAIVGSSKPREGDLYSGLPLDDRLAAESTLPHLGVFIFDLKTGKLAEWLLIEGRYREIFDVVALPGVRRPMAIGLRHPDLGREVWLKSGRIQPRDVHEHDGADRT